MVEGVFELTCTTDELELGEVMVGDVATEHMCDYSFANTGADMN